MPAMPTDSTAVDLVLDALVALATSALQTNVDAGDISRAVLIKAGPRQANPESVSVLFHENDPLNPGQWPHRPLKIRQNKGVIGGQAYVGGGSKFGRAFSAEIEVFGRYMTGLDVSREDARHVAAVVENRLVKALFNAGPKIGTAGLITDSFGETIKDGPFQGASWADQEEGESLIVRKMVRFWYSADKAWTTDEW